MNIGKQMIEDFDPTQGLANNAAGPPKLDPQVAELYKVFESELKRLRDRINVLDEALEPLGKMLADSLDYELRKRGLEVAKHNQFMTAKNCEASPLEQFKYKYGV